MKAKYLNNIVKIPADKRLDINKKILANLGSLSDYGITLDDVFNSYSAKGGLHGLDRKDFVCYSDFSGAKKEFEEGQFFTPDDIVRQIYQLIEPGSSDLIADLTCGIGNFINYAPEESNFYGCEIDKNAVKIARELFPLARVEANDVRFYEPDVKFDLIVGNPPFNLSFDGQLSQYFYFEKAADLMVAGGFLAVITPLSFLSDLFQERNKIEAIEDKFYFLGQYRLPEGSFDADIETKVSIWQRKSEALCLEKPYCLEYTEFTFLKETVQTYKAIKQSNRHRIRLENNYKGGKLFSFTNPGNCSKEEGFDFILRKYLYEVRQHAPKKYNHCLDYIKEFETQTRPSDVKAEEWDRIRITKAKVLAYVKGFLRPHKIVKPACFISDTKWAKRREKDCKHQIPFEKMEKDQAVSEYLDKFHLYDRIEKRDIVLMSFKTMTRI